MHTIKEKFMTAYAMASGKIRVLSRMLISKYLEGPDFIIIGSRRCGTTSMYNYLRQHPNILPAYTKEVNFFTEFYNKGLNWYKANFPTKVMKSFLERTSKNQPIITGEATPYYFNCPLVPKKISGAFPEVKLIALLRNPVDRAYSYYNLHFRHDRIKENIEPLEFIDAIKKENERLKEEYKRIKQNPYYYSAAHKYYSYLDSGLYAKHLKEWYNYFPKEQLFMIESEELFQEPKKVYKETLNFLSIPEWYPEKFYVHHHNKYEKIPEEFKNYLENYYQGPNKELEKLTKKKFSWS